MQPSLTGSSGYSEPSQPRSWAWKLPRKIQNEVASSKSAAIGLATEVAVFGLFKCLQAQISWTAAKSAPYYTMELKLKSKITPLPILELWNLDSNY